MSLRTFILIVLSIGFSSVLSEAATTNQICNDKSTTAASHGGLVKRSPTQITHHRPYPTISSGQRPFCFREHNDRSGFLSFDAHEWNKALDTLCSQTTLSPTDGWRGYVSPDGIVAWGAYARDQSDCSKKAAFDFTEPCTKYMKDLVESCDGSTSVEGFYGYGGGFIQPGPSGCIEYYIAKPSLKPT
ncbi:uncharacterized protein N7511_002273 [Penicillium nucicola]|uniref:uncharacterized protein n=1 Tax=Penicillium nucicola TaxID=1850975 RepID=UPI002544F470|nr:uncharacterized protein N7511_002273 [Penicillium nucicola]KAJ5770222.1 hypothetical protein N7511_002273 [Penicillium nucicola]